MKSNATVPFVVLILALQAIAVAAAWIAKVLTAESTSAFAVLLAADLIAFMIVVHVYRDLAR